MMGISLAGRRNNISTCYMKENFKFSLISPHYQQIGSKNEKKLNKGMCGNVLRCPKKGAHPLNVNHADWLIQHLYLMNRAVSSFRVWAFESSMILQQSSMSHGLPHHYLHPVPI